MVGIIPIEYNFLNVLKYGLLLCPKECREEHYARRQRVSYRKVCHRHITYTRRGSATFEGLMYALGFEETTIVASSSK